MTQQSGATSASDNPEQPQQPQMAEPPGRLVKPAKSNKPAKNLYEPYGYCFVLLCVSSSS